MMSETYGSDDHSEDSARLLHPSTLTDPDTPVVYRTARWYEQWVQCGTCGTVVTTAWGDMAAHFDSHQPRH